MASRTRIPAAVLGLQAALNAALGLYGIAQPDTLIAMMADQFGAGMPRPAAHASSLQQLNMGIFAFFAASRPSLHRRALIANVGLRVLAGYLFWKEGAKMKAVAVWELGFAALNALALLFV